MSSPSPRSQTQTDRRSEIAEAALRVLGREGHVGLTARKVAAEAGLALGHITYNFSGMDEVLSEAYRLLAARLRQASDATTTAASPEARLSAFLRAGFSEDFLTPAHIRTRIDLWSAASAHPAVAKTERELYTHYRSRLEDLLAPLVDAPKVQPVTDMIMATLDGLWLDWMRRRDSSAIENGLAQISAFVALQPRPPTP
ncbi:MAG: TetR family transcriptional regulator C-terminal domain-containing protein [Tabrizicola sp.]|nr:TetR family transcriptional regulator C-terminal domain-containing protein [Tabrizicola sp.]